MKYTTKFIKSIKVIFKNHQNKRLDEELRTLIDKIYEDGFQDGKNE